MSDIKKLIREDLEKMEGKRDVVKAGVLDRMLIKKVPPKQLHVNPADEFSFPDIGPNDSIVTNYSQIARRSDSLGEPVFEDPIIVNKLREGGYLILNGHHRWAGAIQAHMKTVRIQITNTL